MICIIKNASTAMYHLFQYDLSLFIFLFHKVAEGITEINKEEFYLGKSLSHSYFIYFPLLLAIRFANKR